MTGLLIILIVILGFIGFQLNTAIDGIRHILDHLHEHEHEAEIHFNNDERDT